MPTTPRKSSLGAQRRGSTKPHIPYRGDNVEVGKKTGIAVQRVERKSDGFEPFEELMQQADKRTPPQRKDKRRKQSLPAMDEEDEDGEMSMEVESPVVKYFANSRQATTPSNLNRVGSSSRPVARTSDVDYDRVPSPRPHSSNRKSLASLHGPGPSSLSKSFHSRDIQDDYDDEPLGNDDHDQGGMDDGFDDYGPQEGTQEPESPQQTSFMAMDRDEEDDDENDQEDDELPMTAPISSNVRGRGRQQEEPEDASDAEGEVAQGLSDLEDEPPSAGEEDEEEEEEVQPSAKKSRVEKEVSRKAIAAKSRPKKENREAPQGVRRSQRKPYKPLDWWRCEKVVYGRPSSGNILVPHIKEIQRIPKEPVESFSKKRKRAASTRSRSKTAVELPEQVTVYNPEEGWDNDTKEVCTVMDFKMQKEVQRRIAFTSKMVNPRVAANSTWMFQKIFGDEDFIAAGQLVIPPKERKPSKMTKDNTYIFLLLEGAVNLKVHETSMIICTGGMFMVPRGNTYFIENIGDRDAKLFFTQARKTLTAEEEAQGAASSPSKGYARSSSAGMPGSGAPTSTADAKAAALKRASSSRI